MYGVPDCFRGNSFKYTRKNLTWSTSLEQLVNKFGQWCPSFVSEGGIFIYSCSAQLISFSVQKMNLWICLPDLSSWQRHWVWNKLLTTCNNLVDIIRLVTRLFQQCCYNHDITILLQPCVVNLVTFLLHHDCIWHVRTTL